MGLEGECGSITPGKRADLVVLDQNPLEVPPDALRDVAVVQTFVAGRQVWP
jgi:predicted amidohydrolase YtcJ